MVAHAVQAGMEIQLLFTILHSVPSNPYRKKKSLLHFLAKIQDLDFNVGGGEGRETKETCS